MEIALIGRCATCKHWDKINSNEVNSIAGTGVCSAARQIWDVTKSLEDEDGFFSGNLELLPEHAGLLCVVADGSQYRAEFITMPDFGCVQYSKRND
jgi:hypothetical protein